MRAKELLGEESGMAMALAVIMIALFSVMGAGLLVFATTDLGIVVESNQGQRAFEMAEAGVKSAKTQLTSSGGASPSKYDGGSDDSLWSYCRDIISGCDQDNHAAGVTLDNLYGTPTANNATVTIDGRSAGTFTVVSTGSYGNARRRIEAKYRVSGGLPPAAIFATKLVKMEAADACIKGASIFSLGKIEKLRPQNLQCGTTPTERKDLLHGDWNRPPWNTTPRPGQSGVFPSDQLGAGAVDKIEYEGGNGGRRGSLDFDKDTSPKFIKKTPPGASQSTANISFPFDYTADVSLAELKSRAIASNCYWDEDDLTTEAGPGGGRKIFKMTAAQNNYPNEDRPVCFVDFSAPPHDKKGGLIYDVRTSATLDEPRGVLVILDGEFENLSGAEGSGKVWGFEGVILIRRSPSYTKHDLEYQDSKEGEMILKGYVNVDGDVEPAGIIDATGVNPSAYGLGGGAQLQSWREVYSAD